MGTGRRKAHFAGPGHSDEGTAEHHWGANTAPWDGGVGAGEPGPGLRSHQPPLLSEVLSAAAPLKAGRSCGVGGCLLVFMYIICP